jgi:hypothetical protein
MNIKNWKHIAKAEKRAKRGNEYVKIFTYHPKRHAPLPRTRAARTRKLGECSLGAIAGGSIAMPGKKSKKKPAWERA